jgi:hypothetical protein
MRISNFSGGESLMENLRTLVAQATEVDQVRIGFFEDAKYPDDTGVPMVAAMNEYGTSKTPARPFFRNMIAEKSPDWGKSLGQIAANNGLHMAKTMALMGEGIAGQLQDAIVGFDSVPLSDSTVKAKGFPKQLIDTAVMVNAVGYQVGGGDVKHSPDQIPAPGGKK